MLVLFLSVKIEPIWYWTRFGRVSQLFFLVWGRVVDKLHLGLISNIGKSGQGFKFEGHWSVQDLNHAMLLCLKWIKYIFVFVLSGIYSAIKS